MNYSRFLSCIVLSVLLGFSITASASVRNVTLKKALKDRLVNLEATSVGGYCGKSISFHLTNYSDQELNVNVDPAMIFTPEDTNYQNLVLLGNESVAVSAHGQAEVSLQTFCGKSYAHSPHPDIAYHFWKQGDSNMIKTLAYVKQHHIDVSLAQCAVWMYTNNHSLSSVYNVYDAASEDFVKYIASIRHMKIPEYYLKPKLDLTGNTPFVAGNEKVYVDMHWRDDDAYMHMHLVVYKANGDVYRRIEADRIIDKTGSTVTVEFDPLKDVKGTYTVVLYDDANKIWACKKAVVGASIFEASTPG